MEKRNTDIVETRTELGHALDSKAIRTTAYFRADAKAPLLVYVEDCEDIPFWRELFQCVSERYSEINVTMLKVKAASGEPEVNCNGDVLTATGKDALMKVVGLGANKVVAVDRDLDNLITSYHTYSNRIDSDPYVIFTTYYSIENHLVWPGAVNTYLQMMIGTEHDYTSEYAQQLALYNGVLDPILPLMLASNEYSKRTRTCVEYCVDNLTKDMSSLNDKNSIPLFNECKASHSHKCLSLKAKYAYDFDLIIQRLIDVGKYPDELWKVAQGHMLFAFVQSYMYRIIQPIYLALIETIKEKNVNNKRRISIEIEDLKKKMFSRYRNLLTCIDRIMYDNPIIDYSDQGITKILERIKEIK